METESPVEKVIELLGITDGEWLEVLGFSKHDKRGWGVPVYLQCLLEEGGKADLYERLNEAQMQWAGRRRKAAEAKVEVLTAELLERALSRPSTSAALPSSTRWRRTGARLSAGCCRAMSNGGRVQAGLSSNWRHRMEPQKKPDPNLLLMQAGCMLFLLPGLVLFAWFMWQLCFG